MDSIKNNKIGRPKLYFTEEERKKGINRTKAKYGMNTNWYCDICKNNKNYKMCGKTKHLNAKTHQRNVNGMNKTELDKLNKEEFIKLLLQR